MSTDLSTDYPLSSTLVHEDEEDMLLTVNEAWRAVCETLGHQVSSHSHRSYVLAAVVLPSDGPDVLVLGYTNEISFSTADQVYRVTFEEELLRVLNRRITVRIKLIEGEAAAPVRPAPAPKPQLVPVEDAMKRVPKVAVEDIGPGEPPPSRRTQNGLDSRYTFDGFVVGSSNQFAQAACKAVADKPGVTYNPLFLWSPPGLGKTHLAQAVGHQVLRDDPSKKVLYTTSEQFMNELIGAIRNNRTAEFRKRHREVDVLLIDDIQFLARKPATEEEFFHTFNDLHAAGKQIIVTSDTRPEALDQIQERLRSRFQWGLIADVQPPEMETRIAILKSKAQAMNMDLDDDVAQFLGLHIRQNVRQLEGSLVKLSAYANLISGKITLEAAKNLLQSDLSRGGAQIDCEQIMKACADAFRVSLADVKGPSRMKQIARARQSAMYLSRNLLQLSYPEIGRHFARDHSTVMTAVRRVDKNMSEDSDYRRLVETLERELNPNS